MRFTRKRCRYRRDKMNFNGSITNEQGQHFYYLLTLDEFVYRVFTPRAGKKKARFRKSVRAPMNVADAVVQTMLQLHPHLDDLRRKPE